MVSTTGLPEPPPLVDWPNIIGVKIWTVVRSSQREPGYSDDATYTIAGEAWSVPASNVKLSASGTKSNGGYL